MRLYRSARNLGLLVKFGIAAADGQGTDNRFGLGAAEMGGFASGIEQFHGDVSAGLMEELLEAAQALHQAAGGDAEIVDRLDAGGIGGSLGEGFRHCG